MAGHPPDGNGPDPTVDLGADGPDGPVRTAVTGGDWWRQRPAQFGIGALVLAVVVGTFLFPRDGDDAVTVPDVTGMRVADAMAELLAAGLDTSSELVPGLEGVEPGTVLAQDPVADSVVEPGTEVRLQLAGLPPDLVERDDPEVPEVVDLTEGEATAVLAAVGLGVSVQRVPAPEGVTAGTVLAQDPAPGTIVPAGSDVRLEVAEEQTDNDNDNDNGNGNGNDDTGRNIITWILSLAPSAPSGPPEFVAYELLRGLDCAALQAAFDSGELAIADQDVDRLYRGAAAACLAAFDDEAQRWDDAEQALEAVDRHDPALLCFEVTIYDLLDRLVGAYRDNRDGEFLVDPGGGAQGEPPCPTLTGVTPDQGPTGTPLELVGTNLHHVDVVRFYRDTTEGPEITPAPDDIAPDRVWVTVPSMDEDWESKTLCITAVVSRGDWSWDVDGVPFLLRPEDGAEEEQQDGQVDEASSPCPPPPSD